MTFSALSAFLRAKLQFPSRGQLSTHFSHSAAAASLGMRQSPRGERLIEPTFGPSGRQERLNWLAKNRLMNTFSQRRSSAEVYVRWNRACSARYRTFSGGEPKRRKWNKKKSCNS